MFILTIDIRDRLTDMRYWMTSKLPRLSRNLPFSILFTWWLRTTEFTMSNWLTFLHCENFDLCRLCLKEPESNRNVVFIDALQNNLTEQIFEIFGIKVHNERKYIIVLLTFNFSFRRSIKMITNRKLYANCVMIYYTSGSKWRKRLWNLKWLSSSLRKIKYVWISFFIFI